jgi:hypothetical protein
MTITNAYSLWVNTGNSLFGGTLRVMGQSSPVAGEGIEFGYNSNTANIYSFDRTGGTYKNINLNDKMYIQGSDGNVGIGTITPGSKLDVTGTIRATGIASPSSGTGVEIHYAASIGDVFAYDRTTPGYKTLRLNSSSGINILSDGRVGINFANPTYRLVVAGSTSITLPANTYGFLKVGDTNGNVSNVSKNISSYFETGIYVDNGVYVGSDYRIKNNIQSLDNEFCKNFIMKIKPVQYYLNSEDNGDLHYGYIAQDLLKHGYHELTNIAKDDTVEEYIDEEGNKSIQGYKFQISYMEIIPILSKNIEILYEENENQKSKIELLEQKNIDLETRLAKLEAFISTLEIAE